MIPKIWWDSFPTPGPLVGAGNQTFSSVKEKDLIAKQEKLRKKLAKKQRQVADVKHQLTYAFNTRQIQIIDPFKGGNGDAPLDELEFSVSGESLCKQTEKQQSHAAAKLTIELTKLYNDIVETKEALVATNVLLEAA